LRNKTPAERALEVICAKAGVPFEEFQILLEKSQGINATERIFPQSSYMMVKDSYLKQSEIPQEEWAELFQHIKKPKRNFGKGTK
jgi:hypothetical protein